MSTLSVGDIRQRMAALWKEARASGHKFEDMFPTEMQSQLQYKAEANKARDYINQLTEREKNLQQQVKDITIVLKSEKKKVDDLPADHLQLKVDFEQQKNQIEFYRELKKNAETRADKFEQRWKDAMKDRKTIDDAETTIQNLRAQTQQQQREILELTQKHCKDADLFESLRASEQQIIHEQDGQLQELVHELNQERAKVLQLEDDYRYNKKITSRLIEDMDNELAETFEQWRAAQRLQNASYSEAKMIATYFKSSSHLLVSYQDLLRDILTMDQISINRIPADLERSISNTRRDCDVLQILDDAYRIEGVELNDVRGQLTAMIESARKTQTVLEETMIDLQKFLTTIPASPKWWIVMRNKMKNKQDKKSHP
ncbi:hypothetical protein B0J11DRAFT_586817 [Dendryphion nanum]|uniref:Uncharacterized protein n=1 Tax=Dendryphion nanum TaxID=256645 RepID=A0A9P9I6Q4_9PLEO|nr:hypothetical protein B0J11DRAFT_586817 [Dendryphion nanum]